MSGARKLSRDVLYPYAERSRLSSVQMLDSKCSERLALGLEMQRLGVDQRSIEIEAHSVVGPITHAMSSGSYTRGCPTQSR